MNLTAHPTRIIRLARTAHGCRATLDPSPLGALPSGGIVTMQDSDWSHIPCYALWKSRGGRQTKAEFPAIAVIAHTEAGEHLSHLLPLPTPLMLDAALAAIAAHS